MTITINRADSPWRYRISPTDPLVIERKQNKAGGRWTWYARRDTVNEARRMLLTLHGDEQERQPVIEDKQMGLWE